MRSRPLFLLLLCGALAGCGLLKNKENKAVTFDGIRFKAKVSTSRDAPRDMTIVVRDAAQNPEAALQAGHYEAVKYCIQSFGGSGVQWQIGPDTPPEQIRIVDGDLTMLGSCDQRA